MFTSSEIFGFQIEEKFGTVTPPPPPPSRAVFTHVYAKFRRKPSYSDCLKLTNRHLIKDTESQKNLSLGRFYVFPEEKNLKYRDDILTGFCVSPY